MWVFKEICWLLLVRLLMGEKLESTLAIGNEVAAIR